MSDRDITEAFDCVAIVGMAGRFPGARNLEDFWRNLRDGVESITVFSDEELEAAGVDPSELRQPNYVKAGAVLEDVELFDAGFFGFSPREAEVTSPHHRLFLECSWEALERAGYDAEEFGGEIGVYAGVNMNTYMFNLYSNPEALNSVGAFRMVLGNDKDFLPTWVSYKLNLRGPSVNVQTGCSTSLVAVHLACQSLLNYQCDMALAGGVNVNVPQNYGYLYEEGGVSSPDGHCRSFDARAQGAVSSGGVGVVVLKRLDEALADGDTIHAVIRGTAINNDGALKIGYTAPSVQGQSKVIAMALAVGGAKPESVSYVETHGSATPLGDPIEITALTQAFRSAGKKRRVAIGSVKTNIGHAGAAAGIAGLIKTVLALKHRQIPPSLHFEQPNPRIDFDDGPFYVNTRLAEWKADGGARRAGVSSFGIGGTNAHVLLEEGPVQDSSGASRDWQLLLLSAKSSSALETATDNLASHLRLRPEDNLADVAFTLQSGRRAFNQRRALVCRGREDALGALEMRAPQRILSAAHEPGSRAVAFMFPGLGNHYVNMALGLYRAEAGFRAHLDRCCELLKAHLGLDLREVLYPTAGAGVADAAGEASANGPHGAAGADLRRMLLPRRVEADEATPRLNQTYLAQPALFVVEYALAQLWAEWGVRPQAMIGYSIGEYVAACLSGVLSLEDALRVVAERARMIQALPGGAMLAVSLPEGELLPLMGGNLCVAGVNGPFLTVAAGTVEAIEALEGRLLKAGIACRRLETTHAFHSKMVEPVAASFKRLMRSVRLHPPRIPYVSNVTGTWITNAEATDPDYWTRHLCEAVRFAEGLQTLRREPGRVLLEVGPGQMLCSLAAQQAETGGGAEHRPLASLRYSYEQHSDLPFLLNTLAQLWLAGVKIDWPGFYAHERRRRVQLPTYPFERERYWVEAQPLGPVNAPPASAAERASVADWFYLPSWKRSLPPQPARTAAGRKTRWLLLAGDDATSSALAWRLQEQGHDVLTVRAGENFSRHAEHAYTVNPRRREDFAALWGELQAADKAPSRVVHMWGFSREADAPTDAGLFTEMQETLFDGLVFVARELQGRPDGATHIDVVTGSLQDVTGEERLKPVQAVVAGLCQSIPKDYPRITCRNIDLPAPGPGNEPEEILLRLLLDGLSTPAQDELIAYRGRHRWTPDYQPVRAEPVSSRPPFVSTGGVYLVTNCASVIETGLAAYLARTARAQLAFIVERGFPAKDEWRQWLATHDGDDRVSVMIEKVWSLESAGAEVELFAADASDADEMRAVASQVQERFGALHGVIHSALPARDSSATRLRHDAEEDRRRLLLCLRSVFVLNELSRELELELFLSLSSLSAMLFGTGDAADTPTLSYLNALAHAHDRPGARRYLSVNWDDEVAGEKAAEVWPYIFSMEAASQVIVSARDLPGRLSEAKSVGARENEPGEGPASVTLHSRPHLSNAYVEPDGPTEQAIAEIWRKLLGIEEVGAHDDFFQLGGNSLLGIQLTSQLRHAFAVEIPVHALFQAPTVAGLALMVKDILLAEIEGMSEGDLSPSYS